MKRIYDLYIIVIAIALDQITKWWAFFTYSTPEGSIDYSKYTEIIGDFLIFRLVFNEGAVFGSSPHQIFPFLNPTLFYILVFIVAISFIIRFYKKIPTAELQDRIAFSFILSGAFGNFIDRIFIHKVIDFIDVNIPDINIFGFELQRWPIFNIADSFICMGVVLLLLSKNTWAKKPK